MKTKSVFPLSWAACCAFAAFILQPVAVNGAVITLANPTFSIQTAINAASAGDTLLLGPGTYNERIDLRSKQLFVMSLDGAGSTTINAGGSGTAITMGANGSVVEGFTIMGGNASFGGGIDMTFGGTATSIIRNNIFESNSGFGAAIWGNGVSPLIEGNIFRNNDSDNQHLSAVVSFVNGSSPRITNNLFYDNTARAINFVLPSSANPTVVNNTIIRNETGIRANVFGSLTFRNNIVADNGIGFDYEQGPVTWENNLVFGNGTDYDGIASQTGLNGNISADPLFIGAATNDFRLSGLSPAIDAGSSVGAPVRDFDANFRPFDGNGDGVARFDIGAFESVPEPSTALAAFAVMGVILVGRRRSC